MEVKAILKTGCFFLLLFCGFGAEAAPLTADSVASRLEAMESYAGTAGYDSLWYELKRAVDVSQMGERVYLDLYKQKATHHYYLLDPDSLRVYVAEVRRLSRDLHRSYDYYYFWSVLADTYLAKGYVERSLEEGRRMLEEAEKDNDDIGVAFSGYAVATAYLSQRSYPQAERYYTRVLPYFYAMKSWGLYSSVAGNYINALLPQGKAQEALPVFNTLDSLVTVSEKGSAPIFVPEVSVIIRGTIASQLFSALDDPRAMGRYLGEMQELYAKYPRLDRIHLYLAHMHYAGFIKNYGQELRYVDSCILWSQRLDDKVNLLRYYKRKAGVLEQTGSAAEALGAYKSYMELNDSINRRESDERLNELSAKYQLNRLELDNRELELSVKRHQLQAGIAVIAMLSVILLLVIFFYRKVLRLNRNLEKANRMKTEFIRHMTHEIRTPLNAVVGFSQLVAESVRDNEELAEMASAIETGSDELLKLVDDILDISNLDAGETAVPLAKVDALLCCNNAIGATMPLFERKKQVALRFIPPREGAYVRADEIRLTRILVNLLHNAVKFTDRGEVEFTCKADAASGEVEFAVQDTGAGIPEAARAHIFERFYKADKFSQGGGLGLSISLLLAGRMRGRLYLDTSYTAGARFVLVLPMAK